MATITQIGRPAAYPWEFWLARQRLVLRRGRDYACTNSTMASNVRNAASQRGISISVEERDGGLVVTIHGPSAGRKGRISV